MDSKRQMKVRHAHYVLGNMRSLFQEHPDELDVPIQCSNGCFSAHSLILASLSPLFKDYLLEIELSTVKEAMVVLPDLRVQHMEVLFRHILGKNSAVDTRSDLILLNEVVRHLLLPESLVSHPVVVEEDDEDVSSPPPMMREKSKRSSKRKTHPLSSTTMKVRMVSSLDPNTQQQQTTQSIDESDDEEDEQEEEIGGGDDSDEEASSPQQQQPSFKRNSTGTGEIDCHFCDRKYHHVKARNKHMLSEHLSQCKDAGWFYPCDFCSMSFTSISGREKHLQRVHGSEKKTEMAEENEEDVSYDHDFDDRMPCPFQHEEGTTVTFGNIKDLKLHVREAHPDKDRSCMVCGLGCKSKEDVLVHLQTHKGPEGRFLYSCEHCHMKLMSEYALVAHKRDVHSLNDIFACRFCDKRFRNAKFCQNHEQRHETGELDDSVHRCLHPVDGEVCNRVFSTKHNLERHRKSHAKNDRGGFHCEECGKNFVDSTRLKQHKWIHAGYHPYRCKQCDKGFRHVSHLRSHEVQFHGQEKQFGCEMCRKKFLYAYQLRTHMKSHDENKNPAPNFEHSAAAATEDESAWVQTMFQCAICHEVFDTYGKFQQHSSKHSAIVNEHGVVVSIEDETVSYETAAVAGGNNRSLGTGEVVIEVPKEVGGGEEQQQYVIVYT